MESPLNRRSARWFSCRPPLGLWLACLLAGGAHPAAATPHSPFYEFNLVARHGSTPDTGGAIQSIEPAVIAAMRAAL